MVAKKPHTSAVKKTASKNQTVKSSPAKNLVEKTKQKKRVAQETVQHAKEQVEHIVEKVRPRLISFPYWGSWLILFSVVAFFIKASILHSVWVVNWSNIWQMLTWYLARWGNDVLYSFLIWIFAASAMHSKPIWLKSISVTIAMWLLYMYTADVFALIYFHSRFSLSVLWFFSWENAGPYIWYGVLGTLIWFVGLLLCVYCMYWISKILSRKNGFHIVRVALLLAMWIFFTSFFVPQTSSYQQNIVQLDLWSNSWGDTVNDKKYEEYFKSFWWKDKKPNIIVVFAESFSSIDSKASWWSRDLLSWFDMIAKDGTLYTNFIANWCTSDSAHIAMLQWVEPWETKQIQQDYMRYKSYALWLPAFLSQQWYHSSFISTVSLDFLWQKDLLTALQFDTIIGNEAFKSWPKYVFRAAPDKALYEQAVKQLLQDDKKQHQFMVLQTISSHKPYDSPVWDTEEQALWYADSELLQFYRSLQSMHYFDDGILIVVGDHRKMQVMWYDEIEKRWNAAYGKAVFAVVWKDIPKDTIVKTPVQHWDIFSSLKRLTASWDVVLHEYYNDVFGWYEWRNAAVRYCQFVDKQYVATREDGTTWTITPKQRNALAAYIRAYYQFQQGIAYGEVSGSWQTNVWWQSTWLAQFPWLMRIAHQWVAKTAPPNSLEAFYAAKNIWANGIEMDVSFTKDGYPIVMHGPDIGRTQCTASIGKKLIEEFDLQEMKDACKLYNWQVILTLQEVLEKTQNQFSWYFVDIKIHTDEQRAFVKTMLQTIKKLWLQEKVMFSSTDPDVNYQLGATSDILAWWETFDTNNIDEVLDANHDFVLLPQWIITPEIVEKIIDEDKNLIAYTVNDADTMKQLYDWWVRFFITDSPDKIIE